MKSLKIGLLFIIFALISQNLSSQGTVGCRIDCYQEILPNLWHIEFSLPSCPECIITIQYIYRKGICNNVPIRTIEIVDASWVQAWCKDCPGFLTNEERIKIIIRELLQKHI